MSIEKRTALTKQQIKHRIETEEDFIDYPSFGNSIKKLLEKHPNGVKDDTIAKALHLPPTEVETLFQGALQKLKKMMKIGQ